MNQRDINMLRDTLFHTHEDSGSSIDFGHGVVNGVVGALMAGRGVSYATAVEIVRQNLPKEYRIACIPEPWRREICK